MSDRTASGMESGLAGASARSARLAARRALVSLRAEGGASLLRLLVGAQRLDLRSAGAAAGCARRFSRDACRAKPLRFREGDGRAASRDPEAVDGDVHELRLVLR